MKKETEEMQKEIEAELHLDPIDKEVVVLYQGEKEGVPDEFYQVIFPPIYGMMLYVLLVVSLHDQIRGFFFLWNLKQLRLVTCSAKDTKISHEFDMEKCNYSNTKKYATVFMFSLCYSSYNLI